MVVAVVVLGAGWLGWEACIGWAVARNWPPADFVDAESQVDAVLATARRQLPAKGPIGFREDPAGLQQGQEASLLYYQTQYALTPLLVDKDGDYAIFFVNAAGRLGLVHRESQP
jgi:hypothetical protein